MQRRHTYALKLVFKQKAGLLPNRQAAGGGVRRLSVQAGMVGRTE
jgi:hypothetical protein